MSNSPRSRSPRNHSGPQLSPRTMLANSSPNQIPAHNIFTFDNIIFSSNFDNGNLARVERVPNRPYEFKVWTAPDNMGTEYQSKHCAWFHFMVSGLPMGCVLRIQIVNASNHSGLYKHDMRPVYRSRTTNEKWVRIRSSVRFIKDGDSQQLIFEHSVDADNDKIYFSFTYPYSYTTLMNELDEYSTHINDMTKEGSIYFKRELLTSSCDQRRVDLLTITSVDGHDSKTYEPLLSGLFPEAKKPNDRPPLFPNKEVVFISSRVHAGEVPAQHTFKGILMLLMDPDDQCAKALRSKYVFKLIPMLNPDGVYRGHFRMDQFGHNLNRYYTDPDSTLHPAIFAAKSLLDYHAKSEKLALYLDLHAHASKRGCFIYGNILENVEDQIQNQLFCKLISLNSAHFDYEGCLFSKEHMFRTDPGDQAKGLKADGCGRVRTYLDYGLIHSYTLECNYNTSRIGNEVAVPETEILGQNATPASPFTTNPEKYTPSSYYTVGRACIIALLDIKGQNPCSRIPKSKLKTLDRVRNVVAMEVKNRKEYMGKQVRERRRSLVDRKSLCPSATASEEFIWKRIVEIENAPPGASFLNPAFKTGSSSNLNPPNSQQQQDSSVPQSEVFFIPLKERRTRRATYNFYKTTDLIDQSSQNPTPPGKDASLNFPPNVNRQGQNSSEASKLSISNINNPNFNYQKSLLSDSDTDEISSNKPEESYETRSEGGNDSGTEREYQESVSEKGNASRGIGFTGRDLIREHSINKLIKMSSQQNYYGAMASYKDVNSIQKKTIQLSNPVATSKDNRKILGKTLHAAGVALFINGNPGGFPSIDENTSVNQKIGIAMLNSDKPELSSQNLPSSNVPTLHPSSSTPEAFVIPNNPSTSSSPPNNLTKDNLDLMVMGTHAGSSRAI